LKKILLPLLLLFSVNFANAEDILLDAPVVNLGYLESVNGLPFDQTITMVRKEYTPKMVDVQFSYTQVEMICADRMPDGGAWGGGCGGGYCGGGCSTGGCGEKSLDKSWRGSPHYYGCSGNNCNRNTVDRNFMGICRHWTTMETQKSGRVRLVFKKLTIENEDGDIIKLNIHQRDLHSTAFWINGWVSSPNDGSYEVTNLERAVIFE